MHTMHKMPVGMWFGATGGGGRAANDTTAAPAASTTGTQVKPARTVGGGGGRRTSPLNPMTIPRPGGAANTNAGGRRQN